MRKIGGEGNKKQRRRRRRSRKIRGEVGEGNKNQRRMREVETRKGGGEER